MPKIQIQSLERESSGEQQALVLPPVILHQEILSRASPTYQASLYLSYGILLTCEELAGLFDSLGEIALWGTGVLLPKEKLEVSKGEFLEAYQEYLQSPLQALLPRDKAILSSVWSIDRGATSVRELGESKWQVVRRLPVVQLNRFQFRFDTRLERFFTQTFSQETLFWGLEFRFPQLFLSPETSKLIKVLQEPFQNTLLWKKIHGWIRDHTVPVKFEIGGEEKGRVAPFRIGKGAFALGEEILKRQNSHLQLMRAR